MLRQQEALTIAGKSPTFYTIRPVNIMPETRRTKDRPPSSAVKLQRRAPRSSVFEAGTPLFEAGTPFLL